MIEIRKAQTTDGHRIDHFIQSYTQIAIEADELMLFPALIDPHVHFRVPGGENKEDWISGAQTAISGGVTTVFDMPNFELPFNDDAVLVDLSRKKTVEDGKLKTQANWSPYAGWTLRGWPCYTILGEKIFDLETFI